LAKKLLTYNDSKILDPSYGEGALLLSAERVMHTHGQTSFELFGCDIKPVNGLLQHLPQANLVRENFLDYSINKKFSSILMNPPMFDISTNISHNGKV
jgi:hypothetical protein